MGQEDISPALLERGPYGFPARWILYKRSSSTLKIGITKDEPLHYIERHSSSWGSSKNPWQVLHASAHKGDDSPGLVAIYKPKKSMFSTPRDFLINFPNGKLPDIEMRRVDASTMKKLTSPSCYEFAMPVQGGRVETFMWKKQDWGSHCEEVRAIRKEDEPPVHTGDARPPLKEGIHFSKPYTGWVLIRVGGPKRLALRPGVQHEGKGNPFPMGFAENGDEIVASYCEAQGWVNTRKIIFQFWGSGVTGELGEDFTRVASLSACVLWDDEEREREKNAAKANKAGYSGGGME
ncbi:hypothetical protein V8F20_012014 [Naviculisporaceae sp. PSN 640]